MTGVGACCFCGTVRNCAPYLDRVLANIVRMGSEVFDSFRIVLVIDPSSDNSVEILERWRRENVHGPKLMLYINKRLCSPYRTHRLAAARNVCVDYVRMHAVGFPWFVMMDMDDVNDRDMVNMDVLRSALARDDWDGLSFMTVPNYYDIWALSVYPFCFSYCHFMNEAEGHRRMVAWIGRLLGWAAERDGLVRCLSAFNGFSLYRTSAFLRPSIRYDGRPRADLLKPWQLRAHSCAQRGRLAYRAQVGCADCRYEDCEHRAFHLSSGARIRIYPAVLFS